METITRTTGAATSGRPSMPLSFCQPAPGHRIPDGIPASGRSTLGRVFRPVSAPSRIWLDDSGARSASVVPSRSLGKRLSSIQSPIVAYSALPTVPVCERITAAAQFRTQGLSVTPAHVALQANVAGVMVESVDTGSNLGVDKQQGPGAAASVLDPRQGAARGVPPRGRPE